MKVLIVVWIMCFLLLVYSRTISKHSWAKNVETNTFAVKTVILPHLNLLRQNVQKLGTFSQEIVSWSNVVLVLPKRLCVNQILKNTMMSFDDSVPIENWKLLWKQNDRNSVRAQRGVSPSDQIHDLASIFSFVACLKLYSRRKRFLYR